MHRLPPDPSLGDRAGGVALDEEVRAGDEAAEDLGAALGANVQADVALVAVPLVMERVALVRGPSPGIVASRGRTGRVIELRGYDSTFTTSAAHVAEREVPTGPAQASVISTTRQPASALVVTWSPPARKSAICSSRA